MPAKTPAPIQMSTPPSTANATSAAPSTANATGASPATANATGNTTVTPAAQTPLLRIQEVAAETALTPRSIRYYEEMGLLEPAGRSEGAYRLYDQSDLERL